MANRPGGNGPSFCYIAVFLVFGGVDDDYDIVHLVDFEFPCLISFIAVYSTLRRFFERTVVIGRKMHGKRKSILFITKQMCNG